MLPDLTFPVSLALSLIGGFLAFMSIYWATGAGFKDVIDDWKDAFRKKSD